MLQATYQLSKIRKDFLVRIVGPEEETGITKKIHDIAAKNSIEDLIVIGGEVIGKARAALYRSAEIFVLPSYRESFGIVLIEAMCHGIPIVTTNIPNVSEIVSEGEEGFLVNPGDASSLSARLNQLLDDDELRARMSKAGVAKFQSCYAPQRVISQIDQLYQDLLSKYPQ